MHTPWCINCEALSKQVEKLSKHFQGFENLVFARIDASANEHLKLTVKNNLKLQRDDPYHVIIFGYFHDHDGLCDG